MLCTDLIFDVSLLNPHKGNTNNMKENYKLPTFLTEPKYRIWRHLLFILIGAIITFNQVFIAYMDCNIALGNRIYLICISSFLLYLVAIYFNYYYLVPRFLLENRYVLYFSILSVIVFSLPALAIIGEYWVRNSLDLPHRITSYTNPLILVDSLASFVLTLICFLCVTVVQLFRYWIEGNEHVSQLEYENLITQVNKLKGQITPAFLSKTLNNASALVKSNPEKSSDMLMQLGQLLRYQLYDSNRDKVLLKSEVNFLSKFLELEQQNRNEFQYRLHMSNDFNNIFVYPLLFISIVQGMVENTDSLDLSFIAENKHLVFRCSSSGENTLKEDELSELKTRLDLLYPNNYILNLDAGIVELQLNVLE